MTRDDLEWLTAHAIPAIVTMEGASMMPTLPRGTRVRVAPLRELPRRGDLVVIRAGRELILHRAVFVSHRWIGHVGDAGWLSSLAARSTVIARALSLADGAPLPLVTWRVSVRGAWARANCTCRALFAR